MGLEENISSPAANTLAIPERPRTAIAPPDLETTQRAFASALVLTRSSRRAQTPKTPVRLNWQVKTLLPVAGALLNGLLIFTVATISIVGPQRHVVLVVASAGAILICATLLVTLAFVVRRPMLELQDKIRRVRDGDLKAEVNFASRNDDIGDLGRNFNDMVRQLRESRQEIERLHHTQMSRAEHMATMGELAAGLAHEIRNPLAGIAGVMEIIGRDLPTTSPACEVLKDVREEVLRINRIVSELLDTARPKAPDFQLADLNATVEHTIIFARQQSLSKPIEINLHRVENLPPVHHDTRQIHQVLLNLLLNAVQAIDGEGRVDVRVVAAEGGAEVSVQDNGPGIPSETLQQIFRPFFTTKGHGTGLGLPLAQRIVEDHGGRISVQSQVGVGTTFTVFLPFYRPAAKAANLPSSEFAVL